MADLKPATKAQLKKIFAASDFKELSKSWSFSYNRDADMLEVGDEFPEGSYYLSVGGTGVLIRVDQQKKVHGFAIENVKSFIRENPEFALPLSYFAYPIRFYLFYLPAISLMYQTFRVMHFLQMAISKATSDYIAGRLVRAA